VRLPIVPQGSAVQIRLGYAPYEPPKELTMGQLSDDWSEVTQIVNGGREPVAYGLVWLARAYRL
jgi:hypothetical protein